MQYRLQRECKWTSTRSLQIRSGPIRNIINFHMSRCLLLPRSAVSGVGDVFARSCGEKALRDERLHVETHKASRQRAAQIGNLDIFMVIAECHAVSNPVQGRLYCFRVLTHTRNSFSGIKGLASGEQLRVLPHCCLISFKVWLSSSVSCSQIHKRLIQAYATLPNAASRSARNHGVGPACAIITEKCLAQHTPNPVHDKKPER